MVQVKAIVLGLLFLIMGDITIQYLIRTLGRRRRAGLEVPVLCLFVLVGLVVAWRALPPTWPIEPEGRLLGMSTAALYLTGALGYFQCKSLFSRGYSIRVLVDLLQRGTPATLRELQDSYGGRGLRWMLSKRLSSMAALGLLRFDETQVGPLTRRGRMLERFGTSYRRLLRLETVG